jgi:hypothetical protein
MQKYSTLCVVAVPQGQPRLAGVQFLPRSARSVGGVIGRLGGWAGWGREDWRCRAARSVSRPASKRHTHSALRNWPTRWPWLAERARHGLLTHARLKQKLPWPHPPRALTRPILLDTRNNLASAARFAHRIAPIALSLHPLDSTCNPSLAFLSPSCTYYIRPPRALDEHTPHFCTFPACWSGRVCVCDEVDETLRKLSQAIRRP